MGNAISVCFQKYATFKGRATRSEYWFFYLFYILVYFGSAILDIVAGTSFIAGLAVLVLILPQWAVGVRRMHDVDKSGWFLLIPIYNIVLLASSGSSSDNRFGSPE